MLRFVSTRPATHDDAEGLPPCFPKRCRKSSGACLGRPLLCGARGGNRLPGLGILGTRAMPKLGSGDDCFSSDGCFPAYSVAPASLSPSKVPSPLSELLSWTRSGLMGKVTCPDSPLSASAEAHKGEMRTAVGSLPAPSLGRGKQYYHCSCLCTETSISWLPSNVRWMHRSEHASDADCSSEALCTTSAKEAF